MQGQRNIYDSLPETFEFDHGSTSNNTTLVQQSFWNDMHLTPVDAHGIPDYLLDASDANQPTITGHLVNHESHGRAKMEQSWPSTSNNRGEGKEDIQYEAASSLSLENVNISLNRSHGSDSRLFISHSSSASSSQSLDQSSLRVDETSHATEAALCHHLCFPCSSNSSGASDPCSSSSEFVSGNGDDWPCSSFDGRRLSCKRKNIEGIPGHSSVSGVSNSINLMESRSHDSDPAANHMSALTMMPGLSESLVGTYPAEEHLPLRFGSMPRGAVDECYPASSIAGSMQNSHRNFRARINPAQQHGASLPNPWSLHGPLWIPNIWSPDQLPQSVSVNQSHNLRSALPGSSSQSELPNSVLSPIPLNGHPSPWTGNGPSGSRVSSSSRSISSEERLSASRNEINPRNFLLRNNSLEVPYYLPPANVGHAPHDPTIWGLRSESMGAHGNVGSAWGASIGSHPLSGPSWVTNSNAPAQHLSELLRRSLLPSVVSDSVAGSSSEIPGQSSSHSAPPRELSHRFWVGSHGSNQAFLRSAFRHDAGLAGRIPMRGSATSRERRSRVIAEIRNALDLVQRADNLRFENVFVLDEGVLYPGADVLDRHRDMRLDVDDMTYEELLALEERIGNVNTGLSEEAIVKGLKRRPYLPITLAIPPDVEPCCICQEEYVEGEDLGTLNCGHDFHPLCIKQWLMQKNMCPICKETGLVT